MSDVTKQLDAIERTIYTALRPYGFTKHGRTLHRFASGDISQVIFFQTGQAYRGEAHLFTVKLGIRVPECMQAYSGNHSAPKKYYHEYECNIRSSLGIVCEKEETVYDILHMPENWITEDILHQLREYVLPVFELLSSREAILEHRRAYPQFDILHQNIIFREESIIRFHLGQPEVAEEALNQQMLNTYHRAIHQNIPPLTYRNWFISDLELLKKFGLSLWDSTIAEIGADYISK